MIHPFSDYFYPFLLSLEGNGSKRLTEISSFVVSFFEMDNNDLLVLTDGGKNTKHKSRLNYCAAYLKKLGYVTTSKSGYYHITDRGSEVMKIYGSRLCLNLIKTFPEYMRIISASDKNEKMVFIEGHTRNGIYVPPYYVNINNLSREKREKLAIKNKRRR